MLCTPLLFFSVIHSSILNSLFDPYLFLNYHILPVFPFPNYNQLGLYLIAVNYSLFTIHRPFPRHPR